MPPEEKASAYDRPENEVQIPEAAKKKAKEDADLDSCIAIAFNTTEGKEVLQFLRNETIEKPVFRRIGQDIAGANEGYFREGQNELVRQIEMRIKRATNPS